MKAIIVAGGKGERLRPITNTIPKPMVLIGDKPILLHIINLLKKHGVTEFIIAVCYLPEVITSYFGDGSKFDVSITYTFEDLNNPLGTAGAILPARNLVSETCIVTYADILRELDITKMIEVHKKSNNLATINVYKHQGTEYKSSLEFDETNTLIKFIEGPALKREDEIIWSNGAFYIIEPEIFDYIPENTKIDFASQIFPQILSEGKKILVFPSSGYFVDIGTNKKLKKAREDVEKIFI